MEPPLFSRDSDSAPLPPGFTVDDRALNDNQLLEDHAHPSFCWEQMTSFEEPYFEPSGIAQRNAPISSPEMNESKAPNRVGADSARVAMIDLKHASDRQLLDAARCSDGRAFDELSGRYSQMIHSVVFRLLRNREDTEDLVQETMFKAYAHLGKFRGSCLFSTWLTKIAINSALMLLRKRRSHSVVSFDQPREGEQTSLGWEFPDPSLNAEQLHARQQTRELLTAAIKRLPSCYRSILEQYHGEERSLREAAYTLGITNAAAKSRLLRARRIIRASLVEQGISAAEISR